MDGGGVRSLSFGAQPQLNQQSGMDMLQTRRADLLAGSAHGRTPLVTDGAHTDDAKKIVTMSRQQLAKQRTGMQQLFNQGITTSSRAHLMRAEDIKGTPGAQSTTSPSSSSSFTSHEDTSSNNNTTVLPQELVSSLLDFGNWRVRADAMMTLQQLVASLSPQSLISKTSIVSTTNTAAKVNTSEQTLLASLLQLLFVLMKDNNFKMAKTAGSLLCEIVEKSGEAITPHVTDIVRAVFDERTSHAVVGSTSASSPASGGDSGGGMETNTDTIEHSRIIRKLIRNSGSTVTVLDPMLESLSSGSAATKKLSLREEVLDIAVASLVEFPLSDPAFSKVKSANTTGVLTHLLTAIDRQHMHSGKANLAGGININNGGEKGNRSMAGTTTKLYDCCIEAVALLYCQLGKERTLSLIDGITNTENINVSAYRAVMRRLEEEELQVRYRKQHVAAAAAAATTTTGPRTESGTDYCGGTITVTKRFIKDIPWDVPPPSRQGRSRQGQRPPPRASTPSASGTAATNDTSRQNNDLQRTMSGNVHEDDVLKMTDNEKVNLWLPSQQQQQQQQSTSDAADDDVLMAVDMENTSSPNERYNAGAFGVPSSASAALGSNTMGMQSVIGARKDKDAYGATSVSRTTISGSAGNGAAGNTQSTFGTMYEPLQDISSSVFQQHQNHLQPYLPTRPPSMYASTQQQAHMHMDESSLSTREDRASYQSTSVPRSKSFDVLNSETSSSSSGSFGGGGGGIATNGVTRPVSRTQRLHNLFMNNGGGGTGVNGVQRPESVSGAISTATATPGGGSTIANDDSVAGKLSILKRRAINRRAISAGSLMSSPRETSDAYATSNGSAGLRIDVPSPPTAPPRGSVYIRTRAPSAGTATGSTASSSSNGGGSVLDATGNGGTYGGYSPSIHREGRTPKSTPAVFVDSGVGSAGSSFGSSGGSSVMTPNTRQRLRSCQEHGSQPFEEIPTEALLPIQADEVDGALRSATQTLAIAAAASHMELDWGSQYEALIEFRRLTVNHATAVAPMLRTAIPSVLQAVTSLRSHVSKTALILLNEMFVFLGRGMESELESIVPVLVKRSSLQDFLATIARKALQEMCARCDELKVVGSLLALMGGKNKSSSSNSATVRTAACVTIAIATERLIIRMKNSSKGRLKRNSGCGSSAGTAMTAPSGAYASMLERLFQFGVAALDESHPDGRSSGRKVLYLLFTSMDTPSFDSLLRRFTNDSNAKKVKQVIENVMRNHTGTAGGSGAGANTKKGRMRNRSSSNGSSDSGPTGVRERALSSGDTESNALNTVSAGNGATTTTTGNVSMTDDALLTFVSSLSRTDTLDWRKKVDALTDLVDVSSALVSRGFLNSTMLAAIFDHVVHRLGDGNSKVVIQALSTTSHLFPIFGDGSCIALNSLMPLLATTLSSTNDRIKQLTVATLDALIESSDPGLLLQNLTHCVSHGPVRGKHILVNKLTHIVGTVYSTRPSAVTRYALPACFSLLGNNAQGVELRSAASSLANELCKHCGKDAMMQHAASLSATIQSKLDDILA